MLSSLLLLMCGYCFCACDKRLLLTDQDVVQSIQSELQSLRQKIIQLENSQSRISVENTALKSELAHVNGQLATLQQTTEKASSTDVVWGRKTCPKKNGTSMIYSGIMAGKQWYEKGSGVTALCFVIPSLLMLIFHHLLEIIFLHSSGDQNINLVIVMYQQTTTHPVQFAMYKVLQR
uniref:Uncharacterized protein LOC111117898 n=1 Tax=Crassostrea virginica TaxID=6565 RepID=A0A8B8CAQ4_CRAVI|nr:uncharacterized protein LOC111117898 [Crassostrea virginica]